MRPVFEIARRGARARSRRRLEQPAPEQRSMRYRVDAHVVGRPRAQVRSIWVGLTGVTLGVPGALGRLGVGRRSADRPRPEVVEPAGRAAQADAGEAGGGVGRVLRRRRGATSRAVVAPGLDGRALDAQEDDVAGGELLGDRQAVDDGAVVEPLEEDLVGSRELVGAQHVSVVGRRCPGCCRRA